MLMVYKSIFIAETCTIIQKFVLGLVIFTFFFFLKSHVHQGCIYLIKNTANIITV